MSIKLQSILFILFALLFPSLLHAGELPESYVENIEKKLSHLAQHIHPRQPIVGEIGTEQAILVELDKTGSVISTNILGTTTNLELANEAQRLIRMVAPYAPIPLSIANDFAIIRLSVTVSINDNRAISIKEVRAISAQEGTDIVQIMEYFIASAVAAKECFSPDDALKNNFNKNFLMVLIRATQALKQKNPNMSEEELSKTISTNTEIIRRTVANDINKSGCESTSAKQLIQLYKMNASWKP